MAQLTADVDVKTSPVFSSDQSYDRPLVLLDTQVTTSACAVMVRVELRSTVRVEPPMRDRRGGSSVSAETNTCTRFENMSAVLGTHQRRARSRSRSSKNMNNMDVFVPFAKSRVTPFLSLRSFFCGES